MREIHDSYQPIYVTLKDGTRIFLGNEKLGDQIMYYWENDKCTFSKIYKQLIWRGVFHDLQRIGAGVKTKEFKQNFEIPKSDPFDTTSNR